MEFNLNNKGLNEAVRELNERVTKLEYSMSTPAPDNYMVTVEDLMARLKSREERIEALKQENNQLKEQVDILESDNDDLEKDIDMYIDEKNDLYLSNLKLNEQCAKMADEIDRLREEIAAYRDEKYEMKLMKKALNIYQDITELDVSINRNSAFIRLIDSDDAGRAVVKGSELDALCDAYANFHQYAIKRAK